MKRNTLKRNKLVRDGTIVSAGETRIDFRTLDYEVWVTVASDSDKRAEEMAEKLVDWSGGEE